MTKMCRPVFRNWNKKKKKKSVLKISPTFLQLPQHFLSYNGRTGVCSFVGIISHGLTHFQSYCKLGKMNTQVPVSASLYFST